MNYLQRRLKGIRTYPNFLSLDQCKYLVNKFNPVLPRDGLSIHDLMSEVRDQKIYDISSKLVSHCRSKIDKNGYIDYHEVVIRDKRSQLVSHVDKQDQFSSAIIYLNDNYVGGQTKICDHVVTPKVGMMLTFPGNRLTHKLLPIQSGIRYVLTCWFIK